MSTTANRGKVAENLVKARLATLSKSASFVSYRPPDARAGIRQEALSDFVTLNNGRLTLIEVKEVQHDFRLPHGNVNPAQVARMRAWQLAGAESIFLVYHSTARTWRRLNADQLVDRVGGSYDLRNIPTHTLEEVLC